MTRADIKSGSDLRKQENELCQTQGQEDLAFSETIEDRFDRWNQTSKRLGINPITLALADMDVMYKIDDTAPFDAEHLFIDCVLDEIYTLRMQERKKTQQFLREAWFPYE